MQSRIVDAHKLLVSGKITPSQLYEMCLQRIKATSSLNSHISVCEEVARKAVEKSQERYKNGKHLGVLDGIPVAVKDNFATKGIPTTCASKMLENFVPTYTSTVVEKLCDINGGVLTGKTNLDEFAMGCGTVDSFFGPCINPWNSSLPFYAVDQNGNTVHSNSCSGGNDDWYISGGSSGGSAVAVATGSCFAALASDTGGSTRNPASHVGVVGFKPSYGLLSRYGLIPLTHSMDAPSIIAGSVEDISVVFHSIRGRDVRDSTTIEGEIKIPMKELKLNNFTVGLPQEYECNHMSDEVRNLWHEVADILADNGVKINSVSLPHTPYSLSCYSVINCCEVASNFSCYDGVEYGYRADDCKCNSFEELITLSRHEAFGDTVKARILAGNYFLLKENYEKYFVKALKVRRLICEDFEKVFNGEDKVDFLLTPVTLTAAHHISEWTQRSVTDKSHGEDYCTQPVNLAGLPAISLPCKLSAKGLPIGLQLIGPKYSDYFLLSWANILEKVMKFPRLIFREGIESST